MDFSKLAQVTDDITTGKRPVIVDGRVIEETKENPLDKISLREKIMDKQKVIVVDNTFIKKLKGTSREKRREFLSRLTDSQRKRVLSLLKIKDDSATILGYITLDTLLANFMYDPSNENKDNILNFIETQNYIEITEPIQNLIDAVLEDKDLPEDGMDALRAGLGGNKSKLESFVGELVDFEVPEEEELTEEDIAALEDGAKTHLKSFLENKSVSKLVDAAEDLLAEFQGKNRSYAESAKKYWDAMDKAWKEQCEQHDTEAIEVKETIEVLKDIMDDAKLDKIYEGPAFEQGEEVKDTEDRSIASLLVEALEDYAEGNSEKLDTLFDQTLSEEPEEDEEPEEEVEVEEVSEDEEDKLKDSVKHLIKRIKQGKCVNKLVDALVKVCPDLQRMNLKIEDDFAVVTEVPEDVPQVADVPLTCEEYCTMNQDIPAVVACALGEEKPIVWPFKDWKVDGDCINCDGRLYKPYACTLEEVAKRLEEAEDDPTKVAIIGSTSAPLKTFRQIASKCDALNLIDRRFYRPSLGSKSWKFNGNISDLLGDSVKGTLFTRSFNDDNSVSIFGHKYVVS